MKLDNKNIDIIQKIGAFILGLAILIYMGYISGGDMFENMLTWLPWVAILLVFALALHLFNAKNKTKTQFAEKEGKAEVDADNQIIRVQPNIFGGMCDAITVILLITSCLLVFKKGLMTTGSRSANYLAFFTLFSLFYLVMSYLPKQIGGTNGARGVKQARQLVIRSHALSLISSMVILGFVINQIHPFNDISWVLMIILILCLVILYVWKYLLIGPRFDPEGLKKRLEDMDKDNHSS